MTGAAPGIEALAAELCSVGLLHPSQGERCAKFMLQRLDTYVKALEFYRDASLAQLEADAGAKAREALRGKPVVDSPHS